MTYQLPQASDNDATLHAKMESARQFLLEKKMKEQLQDYTSAVACNNRLAKNFSLSAMLFECRSKEKLHTVARDFVLKNLGMTYRDLLWMRRNREF